MPYTARQKRTAGMALAMKRGEVKETPGPARDMMRSMATSELREMASKSSGTRDYKKEYREYHGKPEQIKNRAERNTARREAGLKKGDGREVDHKRPLSKGGSNSKSNLRVTSRTSNRKKYNK